jgi:hypothetical protein
MYRRGREARPFDISGNMNTIRIVGVSAVPSANFEEENR